MTMLEGPTPEQVKEEEDSKQRQQRLNRARAILGTYYVVLPFILIYLLFKVFPPHPWPSPGRPVQLFFLINKLNLWTTIEERLILLVIVAGALGSYIHAATSYSDYRGNRQFSPSWMLWYLLRPVVGVCLALIVYFAIRGGLLSVVLSGDFANDPAKINPFGIAAIAGLTGMFSKQAADKLAEVFNTLFKSQGDASRKDSLTPGPGITGIDPTEGPLAGGNKLTITGTGFAAGAKVFVGGKPAANIEIVSDTSIKADVPAGDSVGVVDVEVVNEAGQKSTKAKAYTYTADGADGDDAGGAGAGDAAGAGAAAGAGTAAEDAAGDGTAAEDAAGDAAAPG
jgi:hypothetical protein